MWTWAYAGGGSTHAVGAGDIWVYRGEGFAEVGVGGGAVIEVRESFTRQGFLADPLTILLPEVRFISLVPLVESTKLPCWWHWRSPGWYLRPRLYLAQSSRQPWLNWQRQREGERWQTDGASTSSQCLCRPCGSRAETWVTNTPLFSFNPLVKNMI